MGVFAAARERQPDPRGSPRPDAVAVIVIAAALATWIVKVPAGS